MWLLSVILAAAPLPLHYSSGDRHLSLIELYTSEGCSSCPPAERWLASLRQSPGLWHDFVPIAFHVNYWDRLGWRDRLSTPAFTQREYAYAAEWGSAQVYTPCFVRDGKEYHPSGTAPESAAGGAGELTLTSAPEGQAPEGQVILTYRPVAGERHLVGHVALLAGGVSNHVLAGENAGATLTHEFVAVATADGGLLPAQDGTLTANLTLTAPLVSKAPRYAWVGWVTSDRSQVPIQAVGGWK